MKLRFQRCINILDLICLVSAKNSQRLRLIWLTSNTLPPIFSVSERIYLTSVASNAIFANFLPIPGKIDLRCWYTVGTVVSWNFIKAIESYVGNEHGERYRTSNTGYFARYAKYRQSTLCLAFYTARHVHFRHSFLLLLWNFMKLPFQRCINILDLICQVSAKKFAKITFDVTDVKYFAADI